MPQRKRQSPPQFAHQLARDQLERIVRSLHRAFYADREGDWDADNAVNGGDFVELAGQLFAEYRMVPVPVPGEDEDDEDDDEDDEDEV